MVAYSMLCTGFMLLYWRILFCRWIDGGFSNIILLAGSIASFLLIWLFSYLFGEWDLL
ncbi:hypothetical protein FDH53_gp106 [Escherichia phage ECD7]|uniref:Transmembrane protein n=1 Tax=Escherichia phage ECD7 TaxID=1981499 RepID=A0A220NTD9_9CAUD|nr:hypothetical protein FDH53_gp106 [Escherichia phage ECD7]ASJ80199.1 hypothetical protein ECD7_00107 [Escherichia phage ECD7]